MRIEAHAPMPISALVLQGLTQDETGDTEQQRGALVIKAAYDLIGSGVREMVPVDDPGRSGIVVQDQGTEFQEDGKTAFDVSYEADVALEKDRTDLVVEKHAASQGAVAVDGDIWLQRDVASTERDLGRNLFGWMPRADVDRRFTDEEEFTPSEGDRLPSGYSAFFNNFYRRSEGFSTPDDRNEAPLPLGAEVAIHQTTDLTDTAYRFRLPDVSMTARLRRYCGHGPDRPTHWRLVSLSPPSPDTLIVNPEQHQALILWRLSWAWTAFDADNRTLQILEAV